MYGLTSTSTMMLRERFLEGFFYYPIMHVNLPGGYRGGSSGQSRLILELALQAA